MQPSSLPLALLTLLTHGAYSLFSRKEPPLLSVFKNQTKTTSQSFDWSPTFATHSISTSVPRGKALTKTHVLAYQD